MTFCKHKLALLAYRELMAPHIQVRLVGAVDRQGDRNVARLQPNAALLTGKDADGRPLLAYMSRFEHRAPTPLCAVRWTERGTLPRSEADLAAFARWLALAAPIASGEPAPAGWDDLVEVSVERPPAMSTAQYRRWLATGDPPALQ